MMTEDEINARKAALMAAEMEHAPHWWWLSFAGIGEDGVDRFHGVAIVRAPGFLTAVMVASLHGCNPGGEVRGQDLMDLDVDPADAYRLLTKDEAEAVDRKWMPKDNDP